MEKAFGKTIETLGFVQVHLTFLYESMWNLGVLINILILKGVKPIMEKFFCGILQVMQLEEYG